MSEDSFFLPISELHRMLISQKHDIGYEESQTFPVNVFPTADQIIVVGAFPDPFLKPRFRERHYCFCDEVTAPDYRTILDTRLRLPTPFAKFALDSEWEGEFVQGPFRWLLRYIAGFTHIWIWCSQASWNTLNPPADKIFTEKLDSVNANRELGALKLDLRDHSDCKILWECAKAIDSDVVDFFISNEDCSEVFQMYHHQNIIISIPDDEIADALLDNLESFEDLIDDWSGYRAKDESNET